MLLFLTMIVNFKVGRFKIGESSWASSNASCPLPILKLMGKSKSLIEVIPAKAELENFRIQHYEQENNDNLARADLDLIDEVREDVCAHVEMYKQRVLNAYNRRVSRREFHVGDLVLRQADALGPVGKLAPNWEGCYKITHIIKFGEYELEDIDGKKLSRPWNSCNLRKFYS
ncbi:UNVERIFIED_CONTAM: hypothetical protein Slati_2143700 [Sesamum latifolium]|uniref:Uncharacterized protein n=1 Tax=Sesamum latifolium TaxID=2727402 RepID=A0AAW2WVT1_9LAMI